MNKPSDLWFITASIFAGLSMSEAGNIWTVLFATIHLVAYFVTVFNQRKERDYIG